MAGNKVNGDAGEQDVVDKVPCPNCGKKLMLLPPNYPMCDVQCTGCNFRAQIKTNRHKPMSEIFGAVTDKEVLEVRPLTDEKNVNLLAGGLIS